MEYQKIINLLDDTTNQISKFRARYWFEVNGKSQGRYNNYIKFKTSLVMSSLFNYRDAYIHVKATIPVPNTAAGAAAENNTNKKSVFKSDAPFTSCITETNNTQVDDAPDIDIVMTMYNLIGYSDVSSKTSGSLWQFYRHEQALDKSNNIIDFPANNINNSISFNFKQQIIRQTGNSGTKDVETIVSIKISKQFLENTWNVFN